MSICRPPRRKLGPRCANLACGATVVAIVGVAIASLAGTGGLSGALAQTPGLRSLADDAGFQFGAATTAEALGDAGHTELLVENVNMISTVNEIDFAVIQPEPGVYDFTRADALVDFAAGETMTARGHGLISPNGLPEWIVNGSWTAESLSAVLVDHVTTVVSRYAERDPGVVTQWDVVDEAFLPDGSPRDSIWRRVIGDDFVRIAFEAARAADPDALLFYDDFYDDLSVTQDAIDNGVGLVPGATAANSSCDLVAKCTGVQSAIGALVTAGVPIDGIGIQAHLLSPDPLDLTTFSGWIEELGLDWAITEFDVPVPITEVANPDSLTFQSDTYATVLSSCFDSPSCNTFVTWGITDRLPPTPAAGAAFGGGLWFDQVDAPKPAAEAMTAVITNNVPTTTSIASSTTSATVAPASDSTPGADVGGATTEANSSTGWIIGVVAIATVAVIVIAVRRRSSPPE